MTQGRILPVMLQFMLPMMLGSIFQNLYSLADMTIASYALGNHALASVSATTALVTLINTTVTGFNTGNAILWLRLSVLATGMAHAAASAGTYPR